MVTVTYNYSSCDIRFCSWRPPRCERDLVQTQESRVLVWEWHMLHFYVYAAVKQRENRISSQSWSISSSFEQTTRVVTHVWIRLSSEAAEMWFVWLRAVIGGCGVMFSVHRTTMCPGASPELRNRNNALKPCS